MGRSKFVGAYNRRIAPRKQVRQGERFDDAWKRIFENGCRVGRLWKQSVPMDDYNVGTTTILI